jgi:hypothetical protein
MGRISGSFDSFTIDAGSPNSAQTTESPRLFHSWRFPGEEDSSNLSRPTVNADRMLPLLLASGGKAPRR